MTGGGLLPFAPSRAYPDHGHEHADLSRRPGRQALHVEPDRALVLGAPGQGSDVWRKTGRSSTWGSGGPPPPSAPSARPCPGS